MSHRFTSPPMALHMDMLTVHARVALDLARISYLGYRC